MTVIATAISSMLEGNSSFMEFINNIVETTNNEAGAVLLVITIFNILFIALTAVLAVICNYICKKKVNLE